MYTSVKLVKIENNQTITKEVYVDFFHELQRGVLLSLKEEGKLNEMQYRNAEEALKMQQRDSYRSGRKQGGIS